MFLNIGLLSIGGLLLMPTACPMPPPPSGAAIGLQLVAGGLVAPVKLVPAPDGTGRLFVVDQIGEIRLIDAAGALLPTSFLDVRARLVTLDSSYDERGLLGLALHPGFASNGRFFVFYTAPRGGDLPAEFDSETHVSEFRVSGDPNRADSASERLILRIGKPQSNHNGGDLAFGPDGFLYISVGDGGGANDSGAGHSPNLGNGQDLSTLLGKILRIDVNSGDPYGIPPDNPFVSRAGARPEIFAYGFRNPFRFSFDPGGSRRLFVADVGQNLFEEVDIVVAGGNYGWNIREGAHCFSTQNPSSPPESCASTGVDGAALIDPIVEYPHNDPAGGPQGLAVIGGHVYRGAAVTTLDGQYVLGDWSRGFFSAGGSLFAATEGLDGRWTLSEFTVAGAAGGRLGSFVLGFGQDVAGEVYVLTSHDSGPSGTTGRVLKLVPP
jgi:glucose/arabinose dehydrogenase